MWSGQRGYRSDKIVALAEAGYYTDREYRKPRGKKKLSRIMAMLLGAVVTLELLVMGAMFMNIDFRSADHITLILGAAVLYFGVVAFLTDK